MPRAFLITHRRYNGTEDFATPGRDYSPERGVRLAGYGGGQPSSDGASEYGSETSSECPEELYNLTKLAEVSLAAAAGTLIHPASSASPRCHANEGGAFVDRWEHRRRGIDQLSSSSSSPRKQIVVQSSDTSRNVETSNDGGSEVTSSETTELSLRERTRLFFERIESEREILETRGDHSRKDLSESRDDRISTRAGETSSNECHAEEAEEEEEEEVAQQRRVASTSLSRKPNSVSSSSSVFSSPSSSSSEGSKSDDSEDHECPDCGKKYSTSSNLARHRQTHRSLADKKARRCPHCEKIYVSMPAYSMHVRTHNQGCKCHYCGKCFSRPWLLQGHIRTHTGEKPFKCTICNKAFADKSNLRAHVQTHSNTKPHVCGRCGKAFALKSYLYKHEESSCTRAHNRASSEKRETTTVTSSSSSSSSGSGSGSSASPQQPRSVETTCVTASPTSVIVQCPGGSSRALVDSSHSTIIRQAKNNSIACEQIQASSPSKRQCREGIATCNGTMRKTTSNEDAKDPVVNNDNNKPGECISRMVIRTSVISPNPEHLVRLGGAAAGGGTLNVKRSTTTGFDFTNPARTSAFSRPTAISLNLAIA